MCFGSVSSTILKCRNAWPHEEVMETVSEPTVWSVFGNQPLFQTSSRGLQWIFRYQLQNSIQGKSLVFSPSALLFPSGLRRSLFPSSGFFSEIFLLKFSELTSCCVLCYTSQRSQTRQDWRVHIRSIRTGSGRSLQGTAPPLSCTNYHFPQLCNITKHQVASRHLPSLGNQSQPLAVFNSDPAEDFWKGRSGTSEEWKIWTTLCFVSPSKEALRVWEGRGKTL